MSAQVCRHTKLLCFHLKASREFSTNKHTLSNARIQTDLLFSSFLSHSWDHGGYLGSFMDNLGTVRPTLAAWCLIYSASLMQNLHTEPIGYFVLGCYVSIYFVYALPDFPNGYRAVCITSNTIQRIWRWLNRLEVSDREGSSEAACLIWESWDRAQNLTLLLVAGWCVCVRTKLNTALWRFPRAQA